MGALNQNSFMQLLIAQLKNQDPMQPMDNSQLIAQLAQFRTLESQTQMSNSINALVEMDQLGQAANLIGKNVETGGSNPISGLVTAAGLQNGVAVLTIGSQTVYLSDVAKVTAGAASVALPVSPQPTANGSDSGPPIPAAR